MYKFFAQRNLAETWRDPDQIEISEEKYFSSFENLCKYVIPYLNNKITEDTEKITEIKLDKNNKWHYSIFGSWMPTYYIEKITLDETYEHIEYN